MKILQKIKKIASTALMVPLAAGLIFTAAPAGAEILNKLKDSRIEDYGGSIEWGGEYSTKGERESLDFTQQYTLHTEGYVWDPRFMSFNLQGRFLDNRPLYETEGRRGKTFFLDFDASAKLLSQKKYPITLFAKRTDREVDRPFVEEYNAVNTRYGAHLDLKYKPFSGKIKYEHRDYEDDKTSSGGHSEDIFYFSLSNDFKRKSKTKLNFNLHYFDDKTGSNDYTSYDVRLDNTTKIGKKKNKKLMSDISFFSQDSQELDDLNYIMANETFQWDLIKSLSLYGKYNLDYRDAGYMTDTNHKFRLEGVHRIFSSLVTTGGVWLNLEDSDYREVISEGFDLNFDYTKNLPFDVRLRLGYGINYEISDIETFSELVKIIDEGCTLIDEIPIELENGGVNESSIIVTDKNNSEIYEEDIDYVVTTEGGITKIARILSGDIGSGEKVFIDYEFNTDDADEKETGLGQRYYVGLSKNFFDNILRLYGDYSYITRDGSFQHDSSNEKSKDKKEGTAQIGADLKWKWFKMSNKIKNYDSKDFDYTLFSNNAYFTINPTPKTYFMIGLGNDYFDYRKDEDKNHFSVKSKAQYRPKNNLLLNILGKYELEEGGAYDGDTITIEPKIEYRLKAWKFELSDEFKTGERNNEDITENTVFFKIKREF